MTATTARPVADVPSVPTAPGRKPVLGHGLEMMRRPVPFLKSLRQQGSVVRVFFGTVRVYALTSSDTAQVALQTKGESFGRDVFNERMSRLIGEGMSTTVDPDFHRRQRRVVQPSLQHQRVDVYVDGIRDVFDEYSARWHDGQVIDWAQEMFDLVTSAMARTLIAGDVARDARAEIERTFLSFLHSVLARMQSNVPLKHKLPTAANRRYAQERARMIGAVDAAVAAYRAAPADRGDLLSILVAAVDDQTGELMAPERVRDEVMGILVAAVDSLALSLTWLFYEFARHPAVEARVLREVADVIPDGRVTPSNLRQLGYTDQVVSELLRMHNPAIAVLRRALQPTEIGGHSFAAGTRVMISPYALGYDPGHYPSPETFDPDRWAPGHGIPHSAYLPFLSGRYKCAGESLAWTTLVLGAALLLPRWRVVPCGDEPVREVFKGSYVQPNHMTMRLERREP